MRAFTKILIAVAIFCSSQAVPAGEDGWHEYWSHYWDVSQLNMKISTSAELKNKLKTSSKDERDLLQDAIDAGSRFIPLHFTNKASANTPDDSGWEDHVQPLVSMTMSEWYQYYDSKLQLKLIRYGNGKGQAIRMICPQIVLAGIKADEEKITLTYRARSIGREIFYGGMQRDFDDEGAGQPYELKVALNMDDQVASLEFPDDVLTYVYTDAIVYMRAFIRDPARFGGLATKEQKENEVKSYRETIQKMEKQAAEVCK